MLSGSSRLESVLVTVAQRLARWLRPLGVLGLVALVASLFALRTFAEVAEEIVEHEVLPVDERARTLVQGERAPALDRAFAVVTWAGDPAVLTVVVGAVALLVAVRRHRRTALLAVIGPLVAAVAIIALKRAFARERPDGALALGLHTASFPSGHATASMASLLTIAYVLARERMVPWWMVPAAAIASGLVGFSRIWLDAHWLTDVAGGWAVGAALALAGIALYERLRVRDHPAPDAPAGALGRPG